MRRKKNNQVHRNSKRWTSALSEALSKLDPSCAVCRASLTKQNGNRGVRRPLGVADANPCLERFNRRGHMNTPNVNF